MQDEPESLSEEAHARAASGSVARSDPEHPVPIAQLITRPDFPKSALGEWVDIGGYTGTVTAVVNQSLKIRSQEGITKSFNAHGLRKIYGPRPEPLPIPEPKPAPPPPPPHSRPEAPAAPPKIETIEPDFTRPVKAIAGLVRVPDYPQALLGEHVDINGYIGVVVAIVNRSLKVRSQAETTRSYNADALRKLHGGG